MMWFYSVMQSRNRPPSKVIDLTHSLVPEASLGHWCIWKANNNEWRSIPSLHVQKNLIMTIITIWFIHVNCLSQLYRNKKLLEIQWKSITVPIFDKAWILDLNVSGIVWFEPHTPSPVPRQLILLALHHRELRNKEHLWNIDLKK